MVKNYLSIKQKNNILEMDYISTMNKCLENLEKLEKNSKKKKLTKNDLEEQVKLQKLLITMLQPMGMFIEKINCWNAFMNMMGTNNKTETGEIQRFLDIRDVIQGVNSIECGCCGKSVGECEDNLAGVNKFNQPPAENHQES